MTRQFRSWKCAEFVPCVKRVLLWGISCEQGQSCPQGSGERYSATRGSWALITPHQDIGGILDQKWPGRIFWSLRFLICILCCPLIWPCFCLRAEAVCGAFLVSHLWLLRLTWLSSFSWLYQLCWHCSVVFTLLEPLLSLFAMEAEYENATPKQWKQTVTLFRDAFH